MNEYGHGKVENPRRHLSDAEIIALSDGAAFDLMSECDYEPAQPTICDACAAYLLRA